MVLGRRRFYFPPDVLRKISSRITNEVEGVNRVTYDISSKPPGVRTTMGLNIEYYTDTLIPRPWNGYKKFAFELTSADCASLYMSPSSCVVKSRSKMCVRL